MAIFGRKREDGAGAPSADTIPTPPLGAAAAAARDADFGVPPFRPTLKDMALKDMAPKPGAAPAMPVGRPISAAAAITAAVARNTAAAAPAPVADRRTLVVGRGISLQGTVADAERLVVEGTVESEMIQAAELFVAQSGVFRGEVQVEDAEIAGLFDGTITVRGNLTIRASGRVTGTARYRKLSVEEGGLVSGRMETLTEQAAASMAPPPSAAPRVPSPFVAAEPLPADAEV